MAMSGSCDSAAGADFDFCALRIFSHWARRRSTSRVSSSSLAPSAAVRTITPASSGMTCFMIFFSRARSGSGSLREMPVIDPPGTSTT